MPDEFESGVFTEGKPAWHGLGVTLPAEALDSTEALMHSGLAGWQLTKQPVYVGNPEDGYRQVPDRFAVTRATPAAPRPSWPRPSTMPVDRYGTVLAPGSLALVHSLLNTASVAPQYPDLLAVLSTAEAWVSAALPEWGHHKGVSVPDLNLVAKDLPRLRELRGAIGMMVGGAPAPGTGLVARLDIAVEAGARVAVHPRGRLASDWIRSAVLAERLTAQLTGIWPRLKVCANPACKVAFYDRSRNLSGTWHDVHICGNRINLRASRARRRDKGDNAAGVAPRE